MSASYNRSAAQHWGLRWEEGWAYVTDGKPVTIAEVRERRREKQCRALEWKRAPHAWQWLAAGVWTFNVPGLIYGGWHTYLCFRDEHVWISGPSSRGGSDDLLAEIIAIFPAPHACGWMEAFALDYPRRVDRRGRPMRTGALDDIISLKRPRRQRQGWAAVWVLFSPCGRQSAVVRGDTPFAERAAIIAERERSAS